MQVSSRRLMATFRVSQAWALTRTRRILAACASFLAALALTYGWNALTGATGAAPGVPFAIRAALSAILIFLGAFVLTGLWYSPRIDPPSAVTPLHASGIPVADGETAQADTDEDLAPAYVVVRAADLPRILYDTNEMPALPPASKNPRKSGGPPRKPPVNWPQHPPSTDDE